ncbi:cellulose biosynthesis protein BcsO [Affinibrenneria salicis]|nr:cellulose biosynthesis protein BcsO [Affinibrenneria salicis]
MNKYDDIKQFKEKLNLEHIDYKDTSENDVHAPSQEWAILKQVAGANGVADDAARQRTGGFPAIPVPVNKEEFRSASLLQAVSQQLPADRNAAAHAAERPTAPITSRQPAPASATTDAAPRNADNADEKPRFRRLFRQKSSAVDENDKRRNTPLKSLLETIALCR